MIAAAIELVDGSGPEELTLREVARRVGVNHRAAYRHFDDKLALFAGVAEQGYRALIDTLKQAVDALPRSQPRARVEAIGVAYVAFAIDHPSHYRIMFGRRLNEDGRFPQLEELIAEAFALISGELGSGQVQGVFGPWALREAVFSFWSMTHGFSNLVLSKRLRVKRVLLGDYGQQILAPFLAGLCTKPGAHLDAKPKK